jgi:hypothetical protein
MKIFLPAIASLTNCPNFALASEIVSAVFIFSFIRGLK